MSLTISNLPKEIQCQILAFTDLSTSLEVRKVSKEFKAAADTLLHDIWVIFLSKKPHLPLSLTLMIKSGPLKEVDSNVPELYRLGTVFRNIHRTYGICPSESTKDLLVSEIDKVGEKIQTKIEILNVLWPRIHTSLVDVENLELPTIGSPVEDVNAWILTHSEALSHISYLDLSGLHLKEVPRIVQSMQRLFTLNLMGNELKGLPDWVLALPNLENLYFDNETENLQLFQSIAFV